MKKPNIIIHLDVTPEESLRRIKMRSRGCETGITLEYLTQVCYLRKPHGSNVPST